MPDLKEKKGRTEARQDKAKTAWYEVNIILSAPFNLIVTENIAKGRLKGKCSFFAP